MPNHSKSINTHFHQLFHLRVDIEMLEVSLFQLFRAIGMGVMSLSLVYYLYVNLEYGFWQIFAFFSVWQLFFVIAICFVGNFVSRLGLKHSIGIRALAEIVFWLSIPLVLTGDFLSDILFMCPLFLVRAFLSSASEMGYSIFLAHHMNKASKGKALAFIQIGIMLGGILAPIIGAVLTTYFGLAITTYVAAAFFALAGGVLWLTPDEKIKTNYKPSKVVKSAFFDKKLIPLWQAEFGWVTFDNMIWVLWPLFLLVIFKDLVSMGLIVGASSGLAMVAAFLIGKKIDDDKKPIKEVLPKSSFRAVIINSLRAIWPEPLFMTLMDAFHRVNHQTLIIPYDHQLYKWLHDKNTYQRANIELFIRNTVYAVAMILLMIFFYFFDFKSLLVFVLMFMLGAMMHFLVPRIVLLK